MPLGPLRETCVQPAPKSRLAVFGLAVYEKQKADQKQIKTFSEASRLKPVPQLEPKSIPQDACDA